MSSIHTGRFTAQIEGDFVVFLIGMRVNTLWAVHKWLPVTQAMPRMLRELYTHPELGFLSAEFFVSWRTLTVFQYWRSFEHLHAYAHAKDHEHLPAWADFNRMILKSGAVGIFHETYQVASGRYECVYSGMPRFGLGRAADHVPAVGRLQHARGRMAPADDKTPAGE